MSKPQSLSAWIFSRVVLSLLAALAGWGGGMVYWILWALSNSVFRPEDQALVNLGSGAVLLVVIGLYMGFYILIVWLFALLPLMLFVPDQSFLWKPGTLTLIGFFTGPIIVCISAAVHIAQLKSSSDLRIYDQNAYLISILVPFGIPAAIVGGATCFAGAILHRRQVARNSKASIQ